MNKKSIEPYCDLMVELKYRIECIDQILDKKIPLRMKIAEELCYLKPRMICELIAIGCLIINEEVSSKKSDILKTYKADWIISQMTRLHPNFFPTPLENEDSKEDPPKWIHKKIGFLTKEDLATLWNKHAGSHLHQGSARNIFNKDKQMNFKDIRKWRDKIVNLLTRHIIISPDEKYISYFIMNDGNGNVHSAVFARQD